MTPSPDRCSECYVPAECVTTCGATGLPLEPVVGRSPSPEVVEAMGAPSWVDGRFETAAEVAQRLINEAVEAEREHAEENYRAFAETCEAYWKLEAAVKAHVAARASGRSVDIGETYRNLVASLRSEGASQPERFEDKPPLSDYAKQRIADGTAPKVIIDEDNLIPFAPLPTEEEG